MHPVLRVLPPALGAAFAASLVAQPTGLPAIFAPQAHAEASPNSHTEERRATATAISERSRSLINEASVRVLESAPIAEETVAPSGVSVASGTRATMMAPVVVRSQRLRESDVRPPTPRLFHFTPLSGDKFRRIAGGATVPLYHTFIGHKELQLDFNVLNLGGKGVDHNIDFSRVELAFTLKWQGARGCSANNSAAGWWMTSRRGGCFSRIDRATGVRVFSRTMSLTLLVLAAGMGSRYGGLKQVDPVGPGGETVLDYAVYDALRAGFTRVVFVIRRDFEALFREKIGVRYAGRVEVDYVFQAMDALPPGISPPAGREKPWGTGHAVWCAREAVKGNFAAINADDFYGADSFAQLARFLRDRRESQTEFAMVGFRLENTLSEHGTVARGVTTTDVSGELRTVVEQTGIAAADVGEGRKFSGKEIVSMNCWGFTPAVFAGLDTQFREFLAARGADPKAEFYLPAAASAMIGNGEAKVRVLATDSAWFGVTYREDKPRVEAEIAALIRAGRYPAKLWP